LELELRGVRAELADVQRLEALLREEMELIREECVPITMQVREAQANAYCAECKEGACWDGAVSSHEWVIEVLRRFYMGF
jgi:hypothetical protein